MPCNCTYPEPHTEEGHKAHAHELDEPPFVSKAYQPNAEGGHVTFESGQTPTDEPPAV